jgi:hypothetical protein
MVCASQPSQRDQCKTNADPCARTSLCIRPPIRVDTVAIWRSCQKTIGPWALSRLHTRRENTPPCPHPPFVCCRLLNALRRLRPKLIVVVFPPRETLFSSLQSCDCYIDSHEPSSSSQEEGATRLRRSLYPKSFANLRHFPIDTRPTHSHYTRRSYKQYPSRGYGTLRLQRSLHSSQPIYALSGRYHDQHGHSCGSTTPAPAPAVDSAAPHSSLDPQYSAFLHTCTEQTPPILPTWAHSIAIGDHPSKLPTIATELTKSDFPSLPSQWVPETPQFSANLWPRSQVARRRAEALCCSAPPRPVSGLPMASRIAS